jgi:hypothetical protein
MFADHQPPLSKLGRSGPDGFKQIVLFTLCTIRVHLHQAVADYPRFRRGEPCRSLWGWKHFGIAEIEENAGAYYELCERQHHDTEGEELEDGLLHIITAVPGLGLAKAGFVSQMIYGVSGCLDGHNLERFQIPFTAYKDAKRKTPSTKSALIRDYNRVCANLGGTEHLWNSWCQYVADRDANYVDADHVSRLHLTPLQA